MGHILDEMGADRAAGVSSSPSSSLAGATGYGKDPNLITPTLPWQMILSSDQRVLISAIADVILPATATEPDPSEIGIAEFFDEWLSAPYPEWVADRTLILAGLDDLETECRRRFSRSFVDLPPDDKQGIVEWLVNSSDSNRRFLVRFRYLVVGGYYTTDIGMGLLGYRGNVATSAFPAISPEGQRIIDEQLKLLGLDAFA